MRPTVADDASRHVEARAELRLTNVGGSSAPVDMCAKGATVLCGRADTEAVLAPALSPGSLRLPSRLLRAAPDGRLVSAVRGGDEKAFEAIYDRHHRASLGFCRHMLGSHEEAEDALQQVFVSAHRQLCERNANINFKPWLYTIARNRCLSMLRSRRETLALEDVQEPSSDGLAVAHEVELADDLQQMLSDIARLPDDQRAALLLAELGDLSHREIAATLDEQEGRHEISDRERGLGLWPNVGAATVRLVSNLAQRIAFPLSDA
jgi:RNA polymerase sigma factor (sigma-70 family)